ncbi:MAG: 7-cyano-7-deazaguanine synthase QueC [Desulfobacteraceae bacterium]|nr:7-cyano-7-deazaguanine synthase QueC [Desulfobacteraceae bacterium]
MIESIIILSGGMDSTVLLAKQIAQNIQIAALSFDYGSKHNRRELPLAAGACKNYGVPHRIIELPFINQLFKSSLLQSGQAVPNGRYDAGNMKKTVVPFRNGILMAIAVGYAESLDAKCVLIGSHSGDHFIYPDCRPEFNSAFSRAAQLGTGGKVSVEFPFSDMDKRQIGDLGRSLDVDYTRTWTCYKGANVHCGVCSACDERKYALRHDEGKDPTSYAE